MRARSVLHSPEIHQPRAASTRPCPLHHCSSRFRIADIDFAFACCFTQLTKRSQRPGCPLLPGDFTYRSVGRRDELKHGSCDQASTRLSQDSPAGFPHYPPSSNQPSAHFRALACMCSLPGFNHRKRERFQNRKDETLWYVNVWETHRFHD